MGFGPNAPQAPRCTPISSSACNWQRRLPEDVSTWLDGGAWTGTMQELIWDEDGEILALRPRPAAWRPPFEQPSHACAQR